EIRAGEGDRVSYEHHQQVLRRRLRGEGMISAVAADPLLRYRDRFPILAKTKYLVSHSLGAMPEAARDALEEFADTWASRGVRAWGDSWWMMSLDVGDVIAPILGAPRGSVVMLPNVTTAEAVVLSSFEYVR